MSETSEVPVGAVVTLGRDEYTHQERGFWKIEAEGLWAASEVHLALTALYHARRDAARWNLIRSCVDGEHRVHITHSWGDATICVRHLQTDAETDVAEGDSIDECADSLIQWRAERDAVKADETS